MTSSMNPLIAVSPAEVREAHRRANALAVSQFRAARRTLHWTQIQAAAFLAVDRRTIERWERSTVRIPAEVVILMCMQANGTPIIVREAA